MFPFCTLDLDLDQFLSRTCYGIENTVSYGRISHHFLPVDRNTDRDRSALISAPLQTTQLSSHFATDVLTRTTLTSLLVLIKDLIKIMYLLKRTRLLFSFLLWANWLIDYTVYGT